jgi:hypothetical protein
LRLRAIRLINTYRSNYNAYLAEAGIVSPIGGVG